MTQKEFDELNVLITQNYKSNLHSIRMEFMESKAQFKPGDYIYNVTGILKIEYLRYEIFFDSLNIKYYGYSYRKYKGELVRTKDKKIRDMGENVKRMVI